MSSSRDLESNSQNEFQSEQHQGKQRPSDSDSQRSSQGNENMSICSREAQEDIIYFKRIQEELIEQLSLKEENSHIQKQIMSDIQDKLQSFKEAAILKSTSSEQLINIRIQELVLNKILVFTYSKSSIRLVLAHYYLGQAYLASQCFQQSIQHFNLSLDKLSKQFLNPEISVKDKTRFQLIQTYIQNYLAKSYMMKGDLEQASEVLKQTLTIYDKGKKGQNREDPWKVHTIILLAQTYSKMNNREQSTYYINEAIKILEQKQDKEQSLGFVLIQKAAIESLNQNYNQAIKSQQKGIEILIQLNYQKKTEVAQMYANLSIYFEKNQNLREAVNSIQKCVILYQQIYEPDHKIVIKGRRRTAALLLKCESFVEAINQLSEIAQCQERVFGENSLQLGRTYKLLGTVCLTISSHSKAKDYFRKSLSIFNSLGNKKFILEVKNKMRLIETHGKIETPFDVKIVDN